MPPKPSVRHVLICEDEGITMMALRKALIHAGHVVVGGEGNGEKAVALARQLRPDLILMDLNLLGPVSGIEATRQILLEQTVPIIVLTAYSDDEHITAALQTGACGYLVKPVTGEQLLAAIETSLARFDYVQAALHMTASAEQTLEPKSGDLEPKSGETRASSSRP